MAKKIKIPFAKTYEELANRQLLEEPIRTRFILYMTIRWPKEEELNCRCGYALEWVERFTSGREYEASNSFGRSVLDKLYMAEVHKK